MKPVLLHVAEVEPELDTGMGRVAHHWIRALEARGCEVVHIGPEAAGRPRHPALFPHAARAAAHRAGRRFDLALVHEPAAGAFLGERFPLVVFSHGLERRGWDVSLRLAARGLAPAIGLRSRLLFPLWRIRPSERAIRAAQGLLLISREDADFAERCYGKSAPHVFRNGVDPLSLAPPTGECTVLFLGSWIPRKGTRVLAEAARSVARLAPSARWVLAGTGRPAGEVLAEWPAELHGLTEVVPRFPPDNEPRLLARAHAVVLPSFFEGQPLALLQAMAAGRACLSSDCCGQRDFIRSGETGLLHPAGDVAAFAAHLSAVISSPWLRERLGAAAREAVRDRPWTRVSDDVVAYVLAVLEGGGAPLVS